MSIFRKKKRARACVIGLDGVPFGLLTDLAARGVMPAAAGLLASGRLHKMRASLPEISAVSWTNFMTGTNSGTHGIFGFTDFKPGSYELRFPNFSDVRAKTFWETLGGMEKRSIVVNQPSTYPARTIPGILISGFVALDMARAVQPPSWRAALDRIGYRIDIDTLKAREDAGFFWQELDRTMSGREKALDLFWGEEWDFFELVVTGTDRLHHFLWNAYEDAGNPHHKAFLDYYRRVDALIAKASAAFRELTGGDKGFYLMSDHGFTGIDQEVYLNAWLEREGYLAFVGPSPKGLEDATSGSRAFALDPNRVYLNLKGKFPKGSVEAADRNALLDEIAGGLEGLEFDGRKVVRKVFRAENVYSGPLVPLGPDLIVLGANGFDMKGSVKKKEVFGRSNLQGMHTWDDAVFWSASEEGADLAIDDLAGIILKSFA
jgi:predicted AlkP superfamily phosphohydrolase/phosphomutase